jgi:hypothetical protein
MIPGGYPFGVFGAQWVSQLKRVNMDISKKKFNALFEKVKCPYTNECFDFWNAHPLLTKCKRYYYDIQGALPFALPQNVECFTCKGKEHSKYNL